MHARSRGTGCRGEAANMAREFDFRENRKGHHDTVYTDMCAFSHTTLTLRARALACVGSACLCAPAGKAAPLQPSAATHAPRPLLAPWRGGAPSHNEARCVEAHCVGGMVGERLLRARPLRRARAAHWSAPCLGSLQRKRSLAMRMRRSFMSSFSFSKSNWPRSISGEEIGGRICSGSSSK